MKILLRTLILSGVGLVAVAGVSQTNTAAPVAAAATAQGPASASAEKQIAALENKLADWPQLGRYRNEDAALAAPAEDEQRVVFYGDSITDAWGRRPGTGTFFAGQPYVNRGIRGQTTPQMVVRFHQDVADLHPRVVVVLAATNDVAGNTGPMTPEMTEDNFRAMVEMARANGIMAPLAEAGIQEALGE